VLKVLAPEQANGELRAAIESLAKAYPENPRAELRL